VEETGGPGENHQPVTDKLYHRIILGILLSFIQILFVVWKKGRLSVYHMNYQMMAHLNHIKKSRDIIKESLKESLKLKVK
jgi:hypothetical protein